MAAYDPKRPRPAQLSDDSAPVDALLEPTPDTVDEQDEPTVAEPTVAEPTVIEPPEPVVVHSPPRSGAPSGEVPVAPAPEVGTTNRAVLYASIGIAAALAALLVVLRLRSRGATSTSAD